MKVLLREALWSAVPWHRFEVQQRRQSGGELPDSKAGRDERSLKIA